jgi:hypothetical protein
VDVGETAKLAALADEPSDVPPVETVNQSMVFPVEVALSCVVEPHTSEARVADILEGVAGGVTVTTTAVRVGKAHVPLLASA